MLHKALTRAGNAVIIRIELTTFIVMKVLVPISDQYMYKSLTLRKALTRAYQNRIDYLHRNEGIGSDFQSIHTQIFAVTQSSNKSL